MKGKKRKRKRSNRKPFRIESKKKGGTSRIED
jgi:hypothetical protein